MSIDYDALTNQIVDSVNKKDVGLGGNILRFEIGDSLLGRFVIYKDDPKVSIYDYNHHGWKNSSGKFVSYLCPSTYGERCPMCAKSIQMYKSNDPFLMAESKKIRRQSNHIANFYVVENPKHPEMNGQVKLLKFGTQIKTIYDDALNGEDKEIFGNNVWRLDSKGCNFRVNVKPNSDKKDAWPSYTSSKFLPPSDLNLTDADAEKILDSVLDHTKIFENRYSYEELELELQNNFIDDLQVSLSMSDGLDIDGIMKKTPIKAKPVAEKVTVNNEDADEIDNMLNSLEEGEGSKPTDKPSGDSDESIDDIINELG